MALACVIKIFLLSKLLFTALLLYSDDVLDQSTKFESTEITPCLYIGSWCKSNKKQFETAILFPEKISYLKPFIVQVKTLSKEKVNTIQLIFSMRGMQMNENQFKLKQLKQINNSDIWQAEIVLPMCISGRKDWLVGVGIKRDTQVENSNFMITIW